MPFSMSWKGLEEAKRDLHTFAERAVPHAARNALNSMAFEARSMWQDEMKRSFTLRNQFTTRSVLVTKATGVDLKRMQAVVGTVAPYMPDQEEGGTVTGRTGQKGIPGAPAAGQQPGTPRTRVVSPRFKLGAIKVSHSQLKGRRRQRNSIALAVAKRKGETVALLERKRGGKALFRIMGGKRNLRLRLLWDFSRKSVRVKPEPTLKRTLRALERKVPHIMQAAVLEQLRRNRVFGY